MDEIRFSAYLTVEMNFLFQYTPFFQKIKSGTADSRIRVMEEAGFYWTYWIFRETTNPDSMALHAQKRDGGDDPINEPLLKVLKEGWRKNAQSGR